MESAVGLKGFKGVVVVVMLAMFAQSVIAATDPIEVDALKSFFLAIGDPMKRLSNWNKGDPCVDQWAGVFCVSEDKQVDHIHELRLLNMNLTGTLAPDLGNLTRLFTLDVMWNNITGSIPEEIGNLKSLSLLLLNGNKLTGVLPESLGNLTNLNRLQIDQNKISGPVPTSFQYLNKTRHFHMNNNSLTGIIPPELGKLQSLAHLLLDNNNLSGPLPPEISNIPTLTILQLDNNRFHGRIPSEYSNMYKLRKMSLRNCSLNGTIPDLTKISNLTYLDLSHNQLTGALPSGKLADTLVTIDLSYNQLEGHVPSNFSDMPKLQFLLLRNNFLNGTVPANLDNNVIFDSPTYRLILDFQYNNFSKSDFNNYPGNVTFLLYGNQACNNSTKPECRSTDVNLNDISLISSIIQVPVGCSEDTCDPSLNQQLVYGLLKTGQCRCASPLLVELRLKSPGFAYFPPYENDFDLYLSSGLNLSLYQVNVSSYHWEAGPRLFMTIALFPTEGTYRFNDSEVQRLYTSFSNWLIPDSITFGPYELMSFPLLFPYNLTSGIGPARNNLSNGAISGIVIGAVILTAAVVAVTMFLFLRKRPHHKAKNIRHERIKVSGVKDFTFEEMAKATSNFNDSMQVGQGGYGKVYRGVLADGQIVAIKRAQEGSLQGANEFYTEIELLSRVHHRNLVSLVGFCDDQEEQMLVYEFIANGTLRDHLSAHTKRPIDFRTRLQIALGSARGILYLHTEANPPIYHRDIKASNILLDDKNKAKVADFGLSRLAPINDMEGVAPGHVSTVVKGTPGYLDPEYFLTHKLTDKSDVYSFGVVLLELVTGMQPISHGKNIVREVKLAYDAGMMLSIIDPRMGSYPSESVEPFVRLAIACCKDDTDARPSMAEVVRDLEDIWQITPWSDSLTSFEASVDLNDMKNMKINALNNPYVSSDIDGSDLLSGTIPNVAPR